MAPTPSEPKTVIKVDPFKPEVGQKGLHNRWHPDIPAFCTVNPGEVFKVECHDWTGGQINNDDKADDVQNVDLTRIHNLSGPIGVRGAKPGDVLIVDILDVTPFPNMQWGYTGVFEKTNGGGLFSKDFDSKAAKAIWDFEGVYATSRHIPGVRFAGIPHPGLIGTAPSAELLATWNKRERGLVAELGETVPAVALVPESKGAYVGQDIDEALRKKIHDEGARTIPGREHGGNVDIKNLSRGSRCYFPVYIEGANLSLGDLHFSQGDGELSFCGAIEMAGIATLKCAILKDGVDKLGLKQPIFLPSPIDPVYSQQIIFEGLSVGRCTLAGLELMVDVNGDGKQYSMDATVAYKQAALNCMSYLRKLGYTKEQARESGFKCAELISDLLLSAAPVESHVAAIVDVPNACVTMGLPIAIFDRDILPTDDGLVKRKYGEAALRSDGVRCKQD